MNDSKSTILTETDETYLGDSMTDMSSVVSSSLHSSFGPKQSVRFGEVRVRTHKVTLGVNPSVSCGLPIELGWDHISSEHFSIENEFDELAVKPSLRRVSSNTRERWLRENGHTSGSFRQVAEEIQEIKEPKKRKGWRATTKPASVVLVQEEERKGNSVKLLCPPIPKVLPGESASCPCSLDKAPKMPSRRTSQMENPLGQDNTYGKANLTRKPIQKMTKMSEKISSRLPFFTRLRVKDQTDR